jgi:hypothetical protein
MWSSEPMGAEMRTALESVGKIGITIEKIAGVARVRQSVGRGISADSFGPP